MKRVSRSVTIAGLAIILGAWVHLPQSTANADVPQSPRLLIGAGNFDNGTVDTSSKLKFQMLQGIGGTRCRVNLYPSVYLLDNDWNRPDPACMDAIILDGIDLHTCYDVQYAPMEQTYERSAQNNFDAVKHACGITRDIHFYATEFNYKRRSVNEDQAARGFLTGIWDNIGVVAAMVKRALRGSPSHGICSTILGQMSNLECGYPGSRL